jgi:hypothetical protein
MSIRLPGFLDQDKKKPEEDRLEGQSTRGLVPSSGVKEVRTTLVVPSLYSIIVSL